MSETVTELSRRCPRCGRQLPPDAPEGLCASCLLTAGAETLTGSSDATSTGVASSGDPSRLGAPRLVDGQLWGPYRVIRLLGRGGMGEVYEAEQLETGRRLALKVLRATLRGDEDRARFLREGQLAASISHAHTVSIFGSEEVGGAPAITMADVRRAACVSGRGVRPGQSRVPLDGGRRRVDYRESRARTA
jgi:eukaryotic-like serine/threonine-protein kinase